MASPLQHEMDEKLRKAKESVVDEKTFTQFLAVLSTDWFVEKEIEEATPSSPYSSGALGWENSSIGAFLDSSFRWAICSQSGLQHYDVPTNPWRRAADILAMGKIYE
ncbi:hypothetical protein [Collimonas fungivorans]|uniref:hypothetical protein n=1 Tax=Collimonas fungivorans TaxID=158899 RepID=UPI0009DAFDFA|nr:hypothetical protein [Collimonas fungivorans]